MSSYFSWNRVPTLRRNIKSPVLSALVIFICCTLQIKSRSCAEGRDNNILAFQLLRERRPTAVKIGRINALRANSLENSDATMSDRQQKQKQNNPVGLVLSMIEHLGLGQESIHLILASQSPRRREILDMMGLKDKYSHTPSPLDESALQVQLIQEHRSAIDPKDYTRTLAEEKARALAESICVLRPTLVLGSDTIVEIHGKILEKPKDTLEAKSMLRTLSGNQHSVHTGVAIYRVLPQKDHKEEDTITATAATLVDSFTDTASVFFSPLSDIDIDSYVSTGEPMDKAGSYGIQGIGGQLVSKVDGDFFTVMGLPMRQTSTALARAISNIIV